MHPFSSPWKHHGELGTNGLIRIIAIYWRRHIYNLKGFEKFGTCFSLLWSGWLRYKIYMNLWKIKEVYTKGNKVADQI